MAGKCAADSFFSKMFSSFGRLNLLAPCVVPRGKNTANTSGACSQEACMLVTARQESSGVMLCKEARTLQMPACGACFRDAHILWHYVVQRGKMRQLPVPWERTFPSPPPPPPSARHPPKPGKLRTRLPLQDEGHGSCAAALPPVDAVCHLLAPG